MVVEAGVREMESSESRLNRFNRVSWIGDDGAVAVLPRLCGASTRRGPRRSPSTPAGLMLTQQQSFYLREFPEYIVQLRIQLLVDFKLGDYPDFLINTPTHHIARSIDLAGPPHATSVEVCPGWPITKGMKRPTYPRTRAEADLTISWDLPFPINVVCQHLRSFIFATNTHQPIATSQWLVFHRVRCARRPAWAAALRFLCLSEALRALLPWLAVPGDEHM